MKWLISQALILKSKLGLGFLATAIITLSLSHSWAHDSPVHHVDSLTREMRVHGATAERLYRRAIEYRSLGKWSRYEGDLEEALRISPEYVPVRLELAKRRLSQGALAESRTLIMPLLASSDRQLRAVAFATRAEVDAAEQHWAQAVEALDVALAIRREVEWYLLRAKAQQQVYATDRLLAGLREGYAETESPLLLRALCDQLIEVRLDDPHVDGPRCHREAMQIIEDELATSRFRSGWLIRRAKLRLLQDDPAGVERDLQAAIAELQTRIGTHQPDPELVKELAEARSLVN